MIICPYTKEELIKKGNKLICNESGFSADIKEDGSVFFHPDIDEHFNDYDASGLDILFQAENTHFWFNNRKKIILELFNKYIGKSDKIIEIGAGTGNVARMLLEKGYQVSVGEIHSTGIEYAKNYGIHERYQFDLMRCPFKEHFDVVGMFDVLEHIEYDHKALENVNQMLKPNGKVVITVPAHMWLWSREDKIAHHKKRYELHQITKLFNDNNFRVIEAKNFFVTILPLLYLRTITHRDNQKEVSKDEYNKSIKVNSIVNKVLDILLSIEKSLLKNYKPSIGGSIILIAQKL